MTTLPVQLDIDRLNTYVADKRLKCQSHPTEDLIIWNYSEVVQFKKLWDDLTLQCRGLITDTAGNVVARSFQKFFNDNERPYEATPTYTVMAKVDGSLGILFYYRNRWFLASRGSFTSPQAVVGMEILVTRYKGLLDALDKTISYNFEIIYPENRIVVNYGEERKLIFLAAFRTNGEEIFTARDVMAQYGVCNVAQFDQASIPELKARDLCNEEGYVVRFENGTRIKIKFPRYVALHRLVGNVNETMLLQEYTAGKTFLEVCEHIPDEFMKWAEGIWRKIDKKYAILEAELEATFATAMDGAKTRGEFARKILSLKTRAALFDRYEGKSPREKLLRLIDVNDLKLDGDELEIAPAAGMSGKYTGLPQRNAPVLVILFGISGSGKSTFAQRWVTSHVNSIVVNRESLALSLFSSPSACIEGKKGGADRRKLVSAMELDIIRNALLRGVSVLVDDTAFLALDKIRKLLQAVPSGCLVQVRIFDVPMSECVDRLTDEGEEGDGSGRRRIDLAEIDKQFRLFKTNVQLVESYVSQELARRSSFLVQNPELPPCYVFDIDGTLAVCGDRNPYEEGKVHLDKPNPNVVDLAQTLHGARTVIHICTGRTEACRQATETWLAENGVIYFTLQMREIGDTRPDYLVKEEMWSRIAEANYIRMLVDDRAQVVHHARSLGLTVAQVAYGEF